MICLNYLKPNMYDTDAYETTNYFGLTEGEFKAQYNNHKKSFTQCIDEKELSNIFGT